MNKFKKYGWWLLILAPLLFAFWVYVDSDRQSNRLVQSPCQEENIDWDIAITALTEYAKNQNPDYGMGSADIKKHFAENCEEDLEIYNKYLASYDWVIKFFNNRIKELVGVEKYEDITKWYTQPKEFSGCDNYLFETLNKKRSDDIYNIRHLMEEKKYKEVITLSDKYLKDTEVWYCDSFFWTQRAEAFYNLGSCKEALKEAVHAYVVSPEDNGNDEPEKEFYITVSNSDICKDD